MTNKFKVVLLTVMFNQLQSLGDLEEKPIRVTRDEKNNLCIFNQNYQKKLKSFQEENLLSETFTFELSQTKTNQKEELLSNILTILKNKLKKSGHKTKYIWYKLYLSEEKDKTYVNIEYKYDNTVAQTQDQINKFTNRISNITQIMVQYNQK